MRACDLLMIKGVRRVEEHVDPPRLYGVTLRVSWWWLWSKRRRARLEDTLRNRMAVGIVYQLKAWWW